MAVIVNIAPEAPIMSVAGSKKGVLNRKVATPPTKKGTMTHLWFSSFSMVFPKMYKKIMLPMRCVGSLWINRLVSGVHILAFCRLSPLKASRSKVCWFANSQVNPDAIMHISIR